MRDSICTFFFFQTVHSPFSTSLSPVNISDHNLGNSFLFCKTQLDFGNTSACFIFFFELFFPLWKNRVARGAEGMVLLNVVYIYDFLLITPAFFLPAARYLSQAGALQWFICIWWCGCSISGVCLYVCWWFGNSDLGKVGQREIFDLLCGERSLYV